jgi:hypothetical protein
MGEIKVRYYTVRRRSGRITLYWQPSKQMREAGFALVNCGDDGPAAWRIAEEWNHRWDEYRSNTSRHNMRRVIARCVSSEMIQEARCRPWMASLRSQ